MYVLGVRLRLWMLTTLGILIDLKSIGMKWYLRVDVYYVGPRMFNLKETNESYVFIHYRLDRTFNLLLSSKYLSVFKGVIKRIIYYYRIRYDMKLEKDDFGIWDNDDEELWKTGISKRTNPPHKFENNNLPDDQNEFGFKDKFVSNKHKAERYD